VYFLTTRQTTMSIQLEKKYDERIFIDTLLHDSK